MSEMKNNPVKTFIQNAVVDGFPVIIKLRFSGNVDWNLAGAWVRDLELNVTTPYGNAVVDSNNLDELEGQKEAAVRNVWNYGLRPLEFIEPVPYENLAQHEHLVDTAKEVFSKLRDSIEASPYMSLHRAELDGISVTAEFLVKP